jgi:hypothetical protein
MCEYKLFVRDTRYQNNGKTVKITLDIGVLYNVLLNTGSSILYSTRSSVTRSLNKKSADKIEKPRNTLKVPTSFLKICYNTRPEINLIMISIKNANSGPFLQ